MSQAAGSLPYAGAPLGRLLEVMRSGHRAEAEDAWAECFRQYHERVWRRVFQVVRTIAWLREPEEAAADVTGQVFLGLPAAARRYREVGRSEAWLMQLAVRTALRYREARTGDWFSGRGEESGGSGRVRSYVSLDELTQEIAAAADIAEADARFDLRRRLEKWREDPARARYVPWIGLFLAGHPHEEIARALGITPGTSRTWLWKIRQHLAAEAEAGMTESEFEVLGRDATEAQVISILPRLDPHPDVEELQLHADTLLDAGRGAVVAAHVRRCAECARTVRQLRVGMAILASGCDVPPDLLARIARRREAGERPLLPEAGSVRAADEPAEVAGRDRGVHPDPPEPGPTR